MERDMKKLNRMELVELLCQMRETMDALTEENRALQERVEAAERKCAQQERFLQENVTRKDDEAALRAEMRKVIEKIEYMGSTIMHCGEADRKIKAAQTQAEAILAQAHSEADVLRAEAERDIEQRREAFTRQCEEVLRGQEMLRHLMEH